MNTYTLGGRYGLIGSVVLVLALVFAFSASTYAQEATESPIVIEEVSVTSTIDESAPVEEETAAPEKTPIVEDVMAEETSVEEEAPAEEVVIEEIAPEPVAEEAAPAEETPTEETAPITIEEVSTTSTLEDTPIVPEADTEATTDGPADFADSTEADTSVMAVAIEASAPELSTENPDYQPGEVAKIFGNFFQPLGGIVLRIFGNSEVGNHYADDSYNITANDYGSFQYDYQLDNFYRPFYTVTASTIAGEELARTTFTDASGAAGDLDQCANGSLTSPVPCTGSAWQNGNLNGNQAHYVEGDSVPYRIELTNLPTIGTNTLVIEYDTRNGGKNAIDYLTSYNRTENGSTDPCSGISPCNGSGIAFGIPIPGGSSTTTNSFNSLSGETDITIWDGTISSVTYPLQDPLVGADSSTRVQIEFTASDPTVVIAWGGHIASRLDWGDGNSAGGINGSSYHMRFIELNGKGGNQDRSLSTNAITLPVQTATLTVIKHVENDNGGTSTAGDWTMDVTATNPSDASFAGSESPGTTITIDAGAYSVTESGGPSGYLQSSVSQCSGTLAAGESATCIITNNDLPGHLIVHKVTDPSTDTTTEFSITASGGTIISPAATHNITGGVTVDYTVNKGTYSVSEAPTAYWDITGNTCVGVEVANGETENCMITNTERGEIIVDKVTIPTGDTQSFSFTTDAGDNFSLADGDLVHESDAVVSGTYFVSEDVPDGWIQTNATCDDGSDPASIDLSPGEVVTCTFENTELGSISGMKFEDLNGNGVKDPDEPGLEGWTILLFDGTNTTISTTTDVNGNYRFDNLKKSTPDHLYGVCEHQEDGWKETFPNSNTPFNSLCIGFSNGGWGHLIDLAPGENVTDKDFGNFKLATITVHKDVVNPERGEVSDSHPFTVQLNSGDDKIVAEGADTSYSDLLPGTYIVTELPDADYDFVSITPTSVTPTSGSNTDVYVVNKQKPATIIVHKDVVGPNGEAVTDDHTFSVDADGGTLQALKETTDASFTVNPGQHTITEAQDLDYGTISYSPSATVTPGSNETVEVTVTNKQLPATLTLTKILPNDNGGTAITANFSVFVSNILSSWGSHLLNPGTYTASESSLFGYLAGPWGTDCATDGSITLASNATKTCTITNDDVAPKLHLRKVVVNDNGGFATAANFTLTADGAKANNDLSGAGSADSGATAQTDIWTLSESGPGGYLASDWVCEGDGTKVGNTITLGIGEEATCTITNDDTPGHFTGGGSIFPTAATYFSGGKPPKDTRVTHGFTLHCDTARLPNRLEINWGPANNTSKFHLLTLDKAVCWDAEGVNPEQPRADIDTIYGEGTGRFQAGKSAKEVDAKVIFTFTDDGEPGRDDTAKIKITNALGNVIYLDTGLTALNLNMGNQQAHQDN